jgi:hypothetical protein
MKHALTHHNKKKLQVHIITIVISTTCSFHTQSISEIFELESFKGNLLETHAYKSLPTKEKNIVMEIHVHEKIANTNAQSFKKHPHPESHKTPKNATLTNNQPTNI